MKEINQMLLPYEFKKYRSAGVSFLVLNALYIIIAWWKMPPVDLAMSKVVYGGFVVFFVLVLIILPLILRGKRLLVQVLAFIYGGRIIFSLYFLIGGDAYPAVPYLLPCVALTFYLLGRDTRLLLSNTIEKKSSFPHI